MAVLFSPWGNQQFFDDNGNPAVGWLIDTYAAGSSTRLATYTDSTGTTPQTNPIVLDSLGFPEGGQVWLTDGLTYKLVLTNAAGVVKKTEPDIAGVSNAGSTISQWQASGRDPTYVSPTSFTLSGDQTTDFHVGRRLQFTVTAGTVYGTILTSAYGALTTITMTMDSGQTLDSGLSAVNLSILRADKSALPNSGPSRTALDVRGWTLAAPPATASNSATIDFTGLSGADDDYMVVMHNVIPAIDDVVLYTRVSQAAAVKTDVNYTYTGTYCDSGGAAPTAPGGTVALIPVSSGISNSVSEGGLGGHVTLLSASGTTSYKYIEYKTGAFRSAVGRTTVNGSGAYRGSVDAIDGLRFYMSSGNIASGTFHLYRLRKS